MQQIVILHSFYLKYKQDPITPISWHIFLIISSYLYFFLWIYDLGMLVFDTGFTKFFHTINIKLYDFIDRKRLVGIWIKFKLRIRKLRVINKPCYLFEIDSIYQLRDLDDSCIVGIINLIMQKLDLWIKAE